MLILLLCDHFKLKRLECQLFRQASEQLALRRVRRQLAQKGTFAGVSAELLQSFPEVRHLFLSKPAIWPPFDGISTMLRTREQGIWFPKGGSLSDDRRAPRQRSDHRKPVNSPARGLTANVRSDACVGPTFTRRAARPSGKIDVVVHDRSRRVSSRRRAFSAHAFDVQFCRRPLFRLLHFALILVLSGLRFVVLC